jgi:amidase
VIVHIMQLSEYLHLDALALAERVHKGAVTPETLLELAIQRTEEVNGTVNAVIHPLYDEARAAARRVNKNAPLAGVPFLVKDLGLDIKGAPRRTGSRGYQNYIGAEDSGIVTKARTAGMVLFGKTNTPELGLSPFTEPELFGPSRNPWNPDYSSGGSSGGAAAAVAAGIVPIASASDGGGSIRIPASCCGLFGLKPSRGRTSWGPQLGEMWSGAAIEASVSRTVRDSAAYLDAIMGAVPGDPYITAPPERPFLEEVTTAPGTLRIGYSLEHTLGGNHTLDEACAKTMQRTIEILRSAGHTVEETALPYRKEDLGDAFFTVVVSEAAADVHALSQYLGRKVRPSDVEAETFALSLLGQSFTAADVAIAKRGWHDICLRAAALHHKYDILLTPTLAKTPIKVGALRSTPSETRLLKIVNALRLGGAIKGTVGQLVDKIYDYMPWTPFANITGQPSMSVPLGHDAAKNLPVGMMFTAALGNDGLLFRLAGQLEQVAPWKKSY